MKKETIAILGCGNLGMSIAHGLLDAQVPPQDLICTRRRVPLIQHLADRGVRTTTDNVSAAGNAEIILLAVKPFNVLEMLEEVHPVLDPGRHLLVSVATGIRVAEIRGIVGKEIPVFRAMPNTATHVRESVTCLYSDNADTEAVERVTAVFDSIGSTLPIQEDLMEAATILGACGVAYALRFIRAMIQGGIQIGFDARTATAIASQTVKGSAELLVQREEHPEQEIDKVTTPKGCTIVGLNEMEHAGFSSSLIKGIVASFNEIRSMG